MKYISVLHHSALRSLSGLSCCLLVLSACYQFNLSSAQENAILLNHLDAQKMSAYRVKRHFYVQRTLDYVFGVNSGQELLLSQVLTQELEPNTSIINLKVMRSYQALDVMIALFTLGIYTPARLTIEGDVIESLDK